MAIHCKIDGTLKTHATAAGMRLDVGQPRISEGTKLFVSWINQQN
jgi:hypothetical protein